MIDQMRQSARSCKQNIVKDISDGTVSTEMCIKLLGIARGSVRELREDYQDHLRQDHLAIWSPDDQRTIATRSYCKSHYDPSEYVKKCQVRSDENEANIMITLISQIDAMLAKVLKNLEEEFVIEGG